MVPWLKNIDFLLKSGYSKLGHECMRVFKCSAVLLIVFIESLIPHPGFNLLVFIRYINRLLINPQTRSGIAYASPAVCRWPLYCAPDSNFSTAETGSP